MTIGYMSVADAAAATGLTPNWVYFIGANGTAYPYVYKDGAADAFGSGLGDAVLEAPAGRFFRQSAPVDDPRVTFYFGVAGAVLDKAPIEKRVTADGSVRWFNGTRGEQGYMSVAPIEASELRAIEDDNFIISNGATLKIPMLNGACKLVFVDQGSGCTVTLQMVNTNAPVNVNDQREYHSVVLGASESALWSVDGSGYQTCEISPSGGAVMAIWNQLSFSEEYAAPGSGTLTDGTPQVHYVMGAMLPRTIVVAPGSATTVLIEVDFGDGYVELAGVATKTIIPFNYPGAQSVRFTRATGAAADSTWRFV